MADEKEKVSLGEAEALGLYRMLGPDGNTIETIRELDAASHQKSSAGFFPSPRPITPLPSYQRGTFCRQFRPAKI